MISVKRRFLIIVFFIIFVLIEIPNFYSQDIYLLLKNLHKDPSNKQNLAALFKIGDQNIDTLIRALNSSDEEVSLSAQRIIRYLGNEIGVKALHTWYSQQQNFIVAGPIPIPLKEWDYMDIQNYLFKLPAKDWGEPAIQYIYALTLDGSPKSKKILSDLIELAKEMDESTYVGLAIRKAQKYNPNETLDKENLASSIKQKAFFISPNDKKYVSTKILAFSTNKDKVLIEVYINRGTLSEEWYHVVVKKYKDEWKIFSIQLIGNS